MFIRLFVFPSEVLPCSYTSAENGTLEQHCDHIFQYNACDVLTSDVMFGDA